MKTLNSHYQEIVTASKWIAENKEEGHANPTFQGYLADTALTGHNPVREVVFNFLLEHPKESAYRQKFYVTSEKDFKEGAFVWAYPDYKVFSVDDILYLCNNHNVEMDNANLKEVFEL